MTSRRRQLTWLLDALVARVPHMDGAVALSRDGLATGASTALSREEAERLAAIAAGFHSLARGAVRQLDGEQVRQVVVDMASVFLFVTAAGDGSCLAVVASADADVGLVAYEMAVFVKQMRAHLGTPGRVVPGTVGNLWGRRATAGLTVKLDPSSAPMLSLAVAPSPPVKVST